MPVGGGPAFVAEYPGNYERSYPRVQQSLGATASQIMGTGVFDGSTGAAVFWFYDHFGNRERGQVKKFPQSAPTRDS